MKLILSHYLVYPAQNQADVYQHQNKKIVWEMNYELKGIEV